MEFANYRIKYCSKQSNKLLDINLSMRHWRLSPTNNSSASKKQAILTLKCHNHRPQADPLYRMEEAQNTNSPADLDEERCTQPKKHQALTQRCKF